MKFLFLMVVVSLNACAFDMTKMHPSFIDAPKSYARVYNARIVQNPACGEPKYEFYYSGTNKPIQDMTGYICLPPDEAQYALRSFNEWNKKNSHCQ